jgi:hypothetical protein
MNPIFIFTVKLFGLKNPCNHPVSGFIKNIPFVRLHELHRKDMKKSRLTAKIQSAKSEKIFLVI